MFESGIKNVVVDLHGYYPFGEKSVFNTSIQINSAVKHFISRLLTEKADVLIFSFDEQEELFYVSLKTFNECKPIITFADINLHFRYVNLLSFYAGAAPEKLRIASVNSTLTVKYNSGGGSKIAELEFISSPSNLFLLPDSFVHLEIYSNRRI